MTGLHTSEQLWWHVARAGGIVALALTSLSVIWGLMLSTKIMKGQPSPAWLLGLHRYLGALAVTFTAVHLFGLVLDSYIQFGWLELLVPFASAWRPGAVALGIVTAYLLVAVQLSSVVMKRLPRTWWRRIHLSSYGLFWTGMLHGALSGTDAAHPFYVAGTAASIVAVLFLTTYRALTARRRGPRPVSAGANPGALR